MEPSGGTTSLFDDFFDVYKLHLRNIQYCISSGLVEDTCTQVFSFWNNLPSEYMDVFKTSAAVLKVALYDKTFYRSLIWAVLPNPFEYERGPLARLLTDISNKYCNWIRMSMSTRLPESSPLISTRLKIAQLFCVTMQKKANLCRNGYMFLSRAHELYWSKHDLEDTACGRIGETTCRQMSLDLIELNVDDITAAAAKHSSSTLITCEGLTRSIYHDIAQLLRDCAGMPQWACWMCNLLVSPILPVPVMAESYGEIGAELSSGYWFNMFWKTLSLAMIKLLRNAGASTSGVFGMFFAWLTSIIEYFVEYRQAILLKSRLDKLRDAAEVEMPSSPPASTADSYRASSAVESVDDVLSAAFTDIPASEVPESSRMLNDDSNIRQWHVPYRED